MPPPPTCPILDQSLPPYTRAEETAAFVRLRAAEANVATTRKGSVGRQAAEAEVGRVADDIARHNIRLVARIAEHYTAVSGVTLDDIISYGFEGLVLAIRKFDHQSPSPTPGEVLKFSTMASWWIRQSIRRSLWERHLIHIPYRFASQDSQETDLFADFARVARSVASLDARVARFARSPSTSRGDELADWRPDAATTVAEDEERAARPGYLDQLIKCARLNDRERRVMARRYGLDGGEPATMEAIGREEGVTKERIRQLDGEIVRKLRMAAEQIAGGPGVAGAVAMGVAS